MRRWVYQELPSGFEEVALPSLAARRGSQRLEELGALLGKDRALAAAEKAGLYLLDDPLAQALRLEGLGLPESGEVPSLSPSRWKPAVAQGLPAGSELGGILLSSRQEQALSGFLSGFSSGRAPESPEGLLEIAAHFFFVESLKVAIRYTDPRFHRP